MFKQLVQATPFYPAMRRLYRRLLRPEAEARKARMRAFYGQFFQPGDLVFDIGANQGEYAEVFAEGGARVIAVEPNTDFRVRLHALSKTLAIEPVFMAVGAEPGSATLNICSVPGYSTLMPDPVAWSAGSPDYDGVAWTGQQEVQITTLDRLAETHGTPAFVKIDVEGYEVEALKGMRFKPSYLSFEFGFRRKPLGVECLNLLGSRGYVFRPIVGREYRFATDDWMELAEALAWLNAFDLSQGEYGDMFCRQCDA